MRLPDTGRSRPSSQVSPATGSSPPFVVDEQMSQVIFTQYVRQYFGSELNAGDFAIFDKLSSHNGAEAAALVEACGTTLLFLPRYSPNPNPIEMVLAKLKHFLRKAGERTREGLWIRIGSLLYDFPSNQCFNYFSTPDTIQCNRKQL